jgi:uncharacterized protein (TIGR00725 family)
VVCGGLDGVMAAAARGAKEAGGTTIGILPGESRAGANPWLDHVVVTGIGHARNLAFAQRLGRPTVILEPGLAVEGVERAATPHEAVEWALAHACA